MFGMEKAPAAGLACYAPMLCNSDYVNWNQGDEDLRYSEGVRPTFFLKTELKESMLR